MNQRSTALTQERSGICPQHGQVTATRTVPRIQFPFLVYGPMRLIASLKSYQCPDCGAKTTKG